MALDRIVIVGGSLAGLRGAEALRKRGFDGNITIVGEEAEPPYNRPPLSKQVLCGRIELGDLLFDVAEGLNIEWRRGIAATALDQTRRMLTLANGETVAWDGLLLATGAKARLPQIPGVQLQGVHSIRTFTDATKLRAEMTTQQRLVIIGAGFIGCEIAASARANGLHVTIIDPAETPLSRILPKKLGATFADLHRSKGVELLLQRTAVKILGDDRVRGVILEDGTAITADIVVLAVGSEPAVRWLHGSGVRIGDGLLCDKSCRVLGGGGRIVAAGDVANWPHVGYGGLRMRVEHWAQAREQAVAAAYALLDERYDRPFCPVLSLWSDQYGAKLQVLGIPRLASRVEMTCEPNSRFFASCWNEDRLVGAVALGMPGKLIPLRPRIEAAMDGRVATSVGTAA